MTILQTGEVLKRPVLKKAGITLIEVLVSISVFLLGVIAVYRPFLGVAGVLSDVESRVEAGALLSEEVWEFQNLMRKEEKQKVLPRSETLLGKRRTYQFTMGVEETSEQGINRVDYRMMWKDAGKNKNLARSGYVVLSGTA